MSGWGDGPWGTMPWGGGDVVITPGTLVTYRLVLANRGTTGLGTPIIDDVLAAGVPMDTDAAGRWSRTLNAAGTLEFSLPIDGCSAADFAPGKRELHLYRDSGSGEVLVWAGHLWAADVRAPWVRFMGIGFYEALRHREVSDDFYKQAVEQRSIAWQLIDYTQNQTGGALGITRASAAGSTVTRTVLYCAEERQVIADAIEDLASADDGFDFDITPLKNWKTWTPERGTDLSDTVELDTTSTIVDMSYTVDGTQVENNVAGIGSKGDCEPIHFYTAVDTDSRDAYGLMQGSLSRSDLKDDDLISALADERLALLKDARKQPTVRMFQGLGGPSPLSGDFDIGDTIAVRSAWGYATFHEKFRVMSYSVSFDRVGNEMLELVLDSRGPMREAVVNTKTIAVTTALAPTVGHGAVNIIAKAVNAAAAVAPVLHRRITKRIAIEGAGAPHALSQSVDATTTVTPVATARQTVRTAQAVAAATAVTAELVWQRTIAKAVAASSAVTATVTRVGSLRLQNIAAATSLAVGAARRVGKRIAAGVGMSGVGGTWDSATGTWDSPDATWDGTMIAKRLVKLITVAATTAIGAVRHGRITKQVPATTTVTPNMARSIFAVAATKAVPASTTLTPAISTLQLTGGGAFRSFSSDSYWNTPLPATGSVHPNSAAFIAWLTANMSNNYLALGLGTLGMPTYFATSSDPLVTITPTGSGPSATFHLPAAAVASTGSDADLLVIDRSTNQEVHLFGFARPAGVPGCTKLTRYYIDSNGLAGDVTGSDNAGNDGHKGIPGSAHVVRFDEVQAGAILHRTKFAMGVPGNDAGQPFWPMDGFDSGTGLIPEGVVMRIKSSYVLPVGLNVTERRIAQHLKDYGTILGDTAAAGKGILKLEAAVNWSSLSVTASSLKTIHWDAYEFIVPEWDKP